MTMRVTARGQVTLPAAFRRRLGLRAGDRLEIVRVTHGRFEVAAKTGSIRDVKGFLPAPKRPVTLAEMDAAIHARAGR